MRRLFVVWVLAGVISCGPDETTKTTKTNNANVNNISVNNINNQNNLNNLNNLNNANNTNNTTVDCTTPQECEPWQTCSVGGFCVDVAGRCADSTECAAWQECDVTWFCTVRDGFCEGNDHCQDNQTCGPDHVCVTDGPTSCNFTYDSDFPAPVSGALKSLRRPLGWNDPAGFVHPDTDLGPISQEEPAPAYLWYMTPPPADGLIPPPITMPGYSDTMPLFSRGQAWSGTRCYETPAGVRELTESEAFDLYRQVVERSLGVTMNTTANFRNVVGLRGAYPGRLIWHRNSPDLFNDTIALLWIDGSGVKHVREFPVSTDTGDNTYTSTSSLLPNRLYRYTNGWHRDYNALAMNEVGYNWEYNTADDANANGHWDNDRNGWLDSGATLDYVRVGSAHNIHMGSVDAPLGGARVAGWSAGCQVIPGMANWTAFINNAWTASGARVDYWLIDARDIDPTLWGPACTADGTHECPFRITSLPYSHTHTTVGGQSRFSVYNCSTADESGPEIVYEVKIPTHGTLSVSVDCADPVDVDIHLIVMDDARACLTRHNSSFSRAVAPGRYLIVADSYVSGGSIFSGAYTLNVSFQ